MLHYKCTVHTTKLAQHTHVEFMWKYKHAARWERKSVWSIKHGVSVQLERWRKHVEMMRYVRGNLKISSAYHVWTCVNDVVIALANFHIHTPLVPRLFCHVPIPHWLYLYWCSQRGKCHENATSCELSLINGEEGRGFREQEAGRGDTFHITSYDRTILVMGMSLGLSHSHIKIVKRHVILHPPLYTVSINYWWRDASMVAQF